MARKRIGGGGAHFHMPLQTQDRSRNGVVEIGDDVLYANTRLECYFFEDFTGDSWTSNVGAGLGNVYQVGAGGTNALIANGANGLWELLLPNTNSQQALLFDWKDQGNIQANCFWYAEARFRIVSALAANQRVLFGLASTPFESVMVGGGLAAITRYYWFRCEGSMALNVECNDGVNTATLLNTGIDAQTVPTNQFITLSLEKTNNGNVEFRCDLGAPGATELGDFTFQKLDSSALDNTVLEPVLLVMKDSGTGTPRVDIDYVKAIWRRTNAAGQG